MATRLLLGQSHPLLFQRIQLAPAGRWHRVMGHDPTLPLSQLLRKVFFTIFTFLGTYFVIHAYLTPHIVLQYEVTFLFVYQVEFPTRELPILPPKTGILLSAATPA